MSLTPRKHYLACPYTHDSHSHRWARARLASEIAAHFMSHDDVVFSPITHGHHIEPHLPPDLGSSHDFWMSQCLPMVQWADQVILLPLQGWRESRGVTMELEFARNLNKRILVVQLVGVPQCELFSSDVDLTAAGLSGSLLEIF